MIGDIIKKLRENADWTQADLANKLNISPSTVGMYEINSRQPNIEIINKLSDIFGVTTDYLLGKEDIDLDDVSFAFSSELEGLSEEQISIVRSFVKALNEENKKKK